MVKDDGKYYTILKVCPLKKTSDKEEESWEEMKSNSGKEPNRYYKIIQFYCAKLVELDAMKNLKNSFISEGAYTKGPKKVKRRGRPKKVVNA